MSSTPAYSKTDLTYEISYNRGFVVERSPRVSVKSLVESGETKYLMHSQSTGQYFDLDVGSKTVWDLIDGKRNLSQIIDEAEDSGRVEDSDEVVDALLFFAESGALMAMEDPVRKKRIRIVSPFEIQAVLVMKSERFLRLTHRMIRPVMISFVFWASMAIILIGVVVFLPRFNSTLYEIRNFRILGSNIVGFLFLQFVVLAPVILVHELAHGVTLVHYGGKAGEIGTGLFYFGPMFYVDSTDSWSLSKRQRIMVMWAGNLSTLLIGALIALSRVFFQYSPAVGVTLDMAAFWCFYITLWNLAPPFETDGYYILTDLVNTPDLKGDSFAYLKSLIRRLLHMSTSESEELTDKKRAIYLSYAIFSFTFVAYLVIQTSIVTSYLAGDATSWAKNILQSASSGTALSPLSYMVGLISVLYFGMIVSGYGVLAVTRVRKSLAGTLRFEAVSDRKLSVFFYVPSRISAFRERKLEKEVRSKAQEITSNFSMIRKGPLLLAKLSMGETSLPFSQLTYNLRRIEDKFYWAYQDFLRSKLNDPFLIGGGERIREILSEMASNTSPGVRSEARGVLKEFLARQERNTRYLVSSTFAAAWTIEISPDEKREVLEDLISTLLVRDLTMTNLAGESEEFKKRIIYGLDSVAEFASYNFEQAKEAAAHPERFQLITSFEPIRGRIVFVGRTERIEKDLEELGSLFTIHVWTGYFDNLLVETNLNLFSIVKSLPPVPVDISSLQEGEARAIDRYASSLHHLSSHVSKTIVGTPGQIRSCKTKLEDLKTLFQPDKTSSPALFESILTLNHENIDSIPSRIEQLGSMSEEAMDWIEALREKASREREKHDLTYVSKRKKILKSYALVGSLSAFTAVASLLSPQSLLLVPLIVAAVSIHASFLAALYIIRRSAHKVPRYPSTLFNQILIPAYALTQTYHSFIVGATLLDPREVIEEKT